MSHQQGNQSIANLSHVRIFQSSNFCQIRSNKVTCRFMERPWDSKSEGAPSEVRCKCKLPTPMKLCANGKNRGRHYWGCAKFPNKECNFFQWADKAGECSRNRNQQSQSDDIDEDKRAMKIKKLKREPKTAEHQLIIRKMIVLFLVIICVLIYSFENMACSCKV